MLRKPLLSKHGQTHGQQQLGVCTIEPSIIQNTFCWYCHPIVNQCLYLPSVRTHLIHDGQKRPEHEVVEDDWIHHVLKVVFPLTRNTTHYTTEILQPLQLLWVGHKKVITPSSFPTPTRTTPTYFIHWKTTFNTNAHTALICFLELSRVWKQMLSSWVLDFLCQWLWKLPYPAE
jgi:hypothetical protein